MIADFSEPNGYFRSDNLLSNELGFPHVMTDLVDNAPAALREGVLALQLHAGFTMDVRYKDVRIKVLRE